jgi:hypothetical protein
MFFVILLNHQNFSRILRKLIYPSYFFLSRYYAIKRFYLIPCRETELPHKSLFNHGNFSKDRKTFLLAIIFIHLQVYTLKKHQIICRYKSSFDFSFRCFQLHLLLYLQFHLVHLYLLQLLINEEPKNK